MILFKAWLFILQSPQNTSLEEFDKCSLEEGVSGIKSENQSVVKIYRCLTLNICNMRIFTIDTHLSTERHQTHS